MCEISGMMGSYAGFSMITFIQIVYFGGAIAWDEMKKRLIAKGWLKESPSGQKQKKNTKEVEITEVQRVAVDQLGPSRLSGD